MKIQTILITAFFTLLPISELRGAIPYAVLNEINPIFAYFFCVILNALIGPVVYIFVDYINNILYKCNWYKKLFDKLIIRARNKLTKKVEKYGYFGIMLFVGIPLPITGAYTGTLGAWVLGLDRKKTCLAVLGGVSISGIIVSLVMFFGIEAADIFIKRL